MNRHPCTTALLLAGIMMTAGCSSAPKAATVADDLARRIGTTSDEVLQPLQRQAEDTGTSVDEIAVHVREQADDAAGRARGSEVYETVVGISCDAVVDSIGTYRENGGSLTQGEALESLYEAVVAQNHQLGVRGTYEDFEEAARKIRAGQNADLDLLIISLVYCEDA